MIRIRFPRASPMPWGGASAPTGVDVTDDPRVIALEGEKNGAAQFAVVDQYIRPAFEKIWSTGKGELFQLILIETRAGCNYTCAFCPVSRHVDPRPAGEMSMPLLRRLADELADFDYPGRIALFGNNEPFLDPRLTEIVRMFREACPDSDIRVLTNGTYVSVGRVKSLFEVGLSTLVINNYTDGRRLIAPVKLLIRAGDQLLPFDIRISVRSRTEILTTRAGHAPNKLVPASMPHGFCALPFTDLYVSYTGMVNLCSFDAYGDVTIGDVKDKPILEIWKSDLLDFYRGSLLRSKRDGLTLCENCDYDGFRIPRLLDDSPFTRGDFENLEQP
jgi:MoaA/NifB/PqqE/SkfB family radical SAM enzyme